MCNQLQQSSYRAPPQPLFPTVRHPAGALLAATARAADQPTSAPTQPVLYLANGRILGR